MEIIKEVKITNYKGLEEVQFPCGSVNILVGPNNTGKSSILESIFMTISSLNHFKDALETELSEIFDFEVEELKHFINQGKNKSTVEIELSDGNRMLLDILYSKEGYPQEVADDFLNFINRFSIEGVFDSKYRVPPRMRVYHREVYELSRDLRFLEKTLQKEDFAKKLELEKMIKTMSDKLSAELEESRNEMIKSEKLFLTSKLNNNLITMHVTMNDYAEEMFFSSDETNSIGYKIPLIISSPKIDYNILTLHKKLVNTKKLQDVLETIKNRIPYFEDIREVEGNYLVSLETLKEAIPLSFMGDGFKALLKLSFMASLVKNGIVLFEEPETSMHPTYMDILAKEIILNSSDAQFFISTHSSELLERILEKAEKLGKLESVKILKLRRIPDSGYIEREFLSGTVAKEEIESIKTDLRGF